MTQLRRFSLICLAIALLCGKATANPPSTNGGSTAVAESPERYTPDATSGPDDEDPPACTNPTAPVDGACINGNVPAGTLNGGGDNRCVPDPQCGTSQGASVNCSANDQDPCQPCVTSCSDCQLYTMKFNVASNNYHGGDLPFDVAFPPLSANAPQCLDNIRNNRRANYNSGANRYHDERLIEAVFTDLGIVNALIDNPSRTGPAWFTNFTCHRTCEIQSHCGHYYKDCVEGTFAFDTSCRNVPTTSLNSSGCNVTVLGETLRWQPSSPISLVWEKGVDVSQAATVVRFPLNMDSTDQYYLWHGSADTPLLVYDPSKSGKVSSPAQLFGNWTFAGQRLASLAFSETAAKPQPWKHGFEALATLDTNADQEISGKELDDLALWFDENRDAISQSGEVKRLSEVGVERLYFGPVEQERESNNVYVTRGFERREANGTLTRGKAVDWFSSGGSSAMELLASHTFNHLISPSAKDLPNSIAQEPTANSYGKSVANSPLRGVWSWHAEGENVKAKGERGLLIIEHFEDGTVAAASLTELPVKDPKRAVSSFVRYKLLDGEIKDDSNGNLRAILTDISSDKTRMLRTSITPDPSQKKLVGLTSERLKVGKKVTEVTYKWEARRID